MRIPLIIYIFLQIYNFCDLGLLKNTLTIKETNYIFGNIPYYRYLLVYQGITRCVDLLANF